MNKFIMLRLCICAVFLCFWSGAQAADYFNYTSSLNTYFRVSKTDDGKDYIPAYEYLSLAAVGMFDDRVSIYVGAWGRMNFASNNADNDMFSGDIQYAYLNYRAKEQNLTVNLGRQSITSFGVMSEIIDGGYISSDIPFGFNVSAFAGSPVEDDSDYRGGDFAFGGRISHSYGQYYSIGVSYMNVMQSNRKYREEEVADIWVSPIEQLQIMGSSAYNSETRGFMQHDYIVSYSPVSSLDLSLIYKFISYKDYFYKLTTNAFDIISLSNPTGYINPDEDMNYAGASVAYSPLKWLKIGGDYRYYGYRIEGEANFYGGKVTLTPFDDLIAGLSVHRMDGETSGLRYIAYRAYVSKQIAGFDMTADFLNISFDNKINGVKDSFLVIGALSYDILNDLKIEGSLEYSKSPEFSNELKGTVKLSYMFDVPLGKFGRDK